MSSLSDLPDELLLQIFVNVAYDGRQGSQLRGICKRFDRLTTERTLPEKIARTQFHSFYLFDKALYARKAYRWAELNGLYAKSQAYEGWKNLLPASDRAVLMTAIALVDAIHDIKHVTQATPTDFEESMLRSGLNVARVARTILPVQALTLIRYLNIVNDEALHAGHHQNPASDLEPSTHSSTQAAVNWLCRSVSIEADMLSSVYPPCTTYLNARSIVNEYDYKLFIASDVVRQLEDASYDLHSCRTSLILEFAIDALLKQHYQLGRRHDRGKEVCTQDSDDSSEQDNTDEEHRWEFAHLDADDLQNNSQLSTRTKLVRVYNIRLGVNAKVRSIFQDKREAQKILDLIDEEAIALTRSGIGTGGNIAGLRGTVSDGETVSNQMLDRRRFSSPPRFRLPGGFDDDLSSDASDTEEHSHSSASSQPITKVFRKVKSFLLKVAYLDDGKLHEEPYRSTAISDRLEADYLATAIPIPPSINQGKLSVKINPRLRFSQCARADLTLVRLLRHKTHSTSKTKPHRSLGDLAAELKSYSCPRCRS
ncbi:hypothetical protein LTR70_006800 [Exophiala xenobiotica]|nr:hypothetical protein LTR70_006800 [Exophiala xenobiotica]